MDLPVECRIYNARLTRTACRANQECALQAARKIQWGGARSSAKLGDVELDRLAGCGQCFRLIETLGGDISQIYVDAITRDITILCEKVLVEDRSFEWDEQQQKRLEKYKRYDKKRRERNG